MKLGAHGWPVTVSACILAALGLIFLLLGGWLVALGGTVYYICVGAMMTGASVLIAAGSRAGLRLYAVVLIVTIIWALYEVGFDGWSLLPRVIAPAVLGAWLFSPWVRSGLVPDGDDRLGGWQRWTGTAICAAVVVATFGLGYATTAGRFVYNGSFARWSTPGEPQGRSNGDWASYGGTSSGDRYSPLAQITAGNVGNLKTAWTFSTGDLPRAGENSRGREFSFEATPIKVGESLFFCTPHRDVVALDATTGQQRWRYSPGGDMSQNIYQACRGVSYYQAWPGDPCPHRIVSTAAGAPTLFELDADTGRPCETFGSKGMVDLRAGMGPVPPGFHFITSPPMVLRDRIVLSGWVYDNQSVQEPSGVVRAFDARTGKLVWAWDVGRSPTNKPLGPGEVFTRGTPNGWGVYTADPALGLVYVPTGNATPDYFGGRRRPFDDKFSSSLVALDIETGLERWHFQLVHHDLWDFDVPVGPSLVDLPGPRGDTVPALVQTSKQGQLYLLDRRTGRPLAQVTERPVPSGQLAGERYSRTQPFSTGMPNLTPDHMVATHTWGITPVDQLICRLQLAQMRNDGLFTPPGVDRPVLGDPAFDGVMDWYGATIDPVRKILYANYMEMPFVFTTYTREAALKKHMFKPWAGWGHPYPEPLFDNNPQHGLPYAQVVKPWLGVFGAPCVAPPWGTLAAIDLIKRKTIWSRPVGTTANMGPYNLRVPIGLSTGIFMMGGNITTASGLVFMGATTDQAFRAFDGRTGRILWQTTLPAGGNATPMTYLGRDGRQYVVIAAGGHGGLRSRNGDQIVAFALDRNANQAP